MGVTLIFPGQGSQYVGMGKNLMSDPECKKIFDLADDALGFKLSQLCLEGPESELTLTKYTQPAIVTHSYALFTKLKKILSKKNITIDRVLGHSVGEYSALAAAEVLSPADAIRAVHHRGLYMQEAVPEGVGSMAAILRVPAEIVKEACQAVSTLEHKVMAANFNEPGQTVISGHAKACQDAVTWLQQNYSGKHMAIPLKVSAPFHSSLMKPAEDKLASFFETIEFKPNEIAYVANVDAVEYSAGTRGPEIKKNLIQQVCSSVLWYQSIEKLTKDTLFIEVGPGKVLTGLNKKINSELKTYTLDSDSGFEGLEEFLA